MELVSLTVPPIRFVEQETVRSVLGWGIIVRLSGPRASLSLFSAIVGEVTIKSDNLVRKERSTG